VVGRVERSRKLVLADWTKANDALNHHFEGNKSKLTTHLNMSRTTVTAFFKLMPVREAEFRKICLALRLNWQEVSQVEMGLPQPEHDTDTHFQEIREQCRQKILNQHSRMRLLSGNEIGVDQLYVDVWLLNRSPRTFMVSPSKFLESFDLRNDRLGLGDRIQRTQGFEVANTNTKLLILGKPGAGKTTFLKHLAVDWCKGNFQPDLIAVLIEFRRIQDQQWGLMYAIEKELGLENWSQIQEIKKQISFLKKEHSTKDEIQRLEQQLESLPLQVLLKQGKLLILMDGLDEVPTNDLRRNVQNQLHQLVKDYPNNRFILTCRTQIIESIPNGFNSVEVADFSTDQVETFVENWFKANGKSESEVIQQWKKFDNAVSKNAALKELTVTPVLLSLMCLVLQDEGEIPLQMTWLYEKGIKLLLSKWNDAKTIDGWEVGTEIYRQLSIDQKEALLTKIAVRKFKNPENFVLFEQEEITSYITKFLQLTNRQEGIAVLKAIEAQHGLLIERADELWSFSHLTFQEHFTIQWLASLPSQKLAEKIGNYQLQGVVKKLVNSQQPSDKLLLKIKISIDLLIASELRLQEFLNWGFQKQKTNQANYKSSAIRAFYLALERLLECFPNIDASNFSLDSPLPLDRTLARNLDPNLDYALEINYDLISVESILAINLNSPLSLDRTLALNLDPDLAYALEFDCTFTHKSDYAFSLELTLVVALLFAFKLDSVSNLDLVLHHASARAYALASNYNYNLELVNKLEQLRAALPINTHENSQQWWKINSIQWSEQLRQVMIEYRNIGHDWQFSDTQKQQLQRYYNLNKFLVDLINIEGVVSDKVRSEIEESLLLPWAELQRRFPEVYGENLR
jgi:predicted NACHT family NTPase